MASPGGFPPTNFWNAQDSGMRDLLDDLFEAERLAPLSNGLDRVHAMLRFLLAVNEEVNAPGNAFATPDMILAMADRLAEEHDAIGNGGGATESAIAALPRVKLDVSKLDNNGGAVCSICMEPLALGNEVVELPCRHWFCGDCICMWLRLNNSCPQCRQGIYPMPANRDERVLDTPNRSQPDEAQLNPQEGDRSPSTTTLNPFHRTENDLAPDTSNQTSEAAPTPLGAAGGRSLDQEAPPTISLGAPPTHLPLSPESLIRIVGWWLTEEDLERVRLAHEQTRPGEPFSGPTRPASSAPRAITFSVGGLSFTLGLEPVPMNWPSLLPREWQGRPNVQDDEDEEDATDEDATDEEDADENDADEDDADEHGVDGIERDDLAREHEG